MFCFIYLGDDNSALLVRVNLLVNAVKQGKLTLGEALKSSAIDSIQKARDDWRAKMSNHRTAKLWIQYQRMIEILRAFIRSVRIGDWYLYLQCLCDMHPYFAAAGHNNYTKSLSIFIQKMQDLQTNHPDVYEAFSKGLFPVRRTEGVWAGIPTDLFIEQVLMAGIKSSGGLTHGRGFEESTRLLFMLSRPICAEVCHSIFRVAGLTSDKPDGHRDLQQSRINRDMSDIQKLLEVFIERDPFSSASNKLVSLSTGLVGDQSVNADDAQAVGKRVISSMSGCCVADYKFAQKDQVKTLASATYAKTSSGERIEINPSHLYQRLLLMGVGEIPLRELLQYELCSLPSSLFDNSLQMRTGDKAELIHHFMKLVPASVILRLPKSGLQFVVDGGGLLHKFQWPKNSTYAEICQTYVRHIHNSYGEGTLVVFDGYRGPSTKDEAHRKRSGVDVGASVAVSDEMRLSMKKKAFLGNGSNKQALINLLAGKMEEQGIRVEHAEGDADYTICRSACVSTATKPTAVVAEDSDVFQLMVHHVDDTQFDLYMVMAKQTVCISRLKKKIDRSLSHGLLFLHALSGCDTTSRPFGLGKVTVLKKFALLKDSAKVFMDKSSSKGAVEKAGEKALLVLYGCPESRDLTSARVEKFSMKVATSAGYVPPEKLPPTSDAARFHSQRTYHQVQAWLANDLPPQEWGWQVCADELYPVRMQQSAAPEKLLQVIRCNCSGNCQKKNCTCQKNGLRCSSACGQCKGISCLNGPQIESGIEDDDDGDDT